MLSSLSPTLYHGEWVQVTGQNSLSGVRARLVWMEPTIWSLFLSGLGYPLPTRKPRSLCSFVILRQDILRTTYHVICWCLLGNSTSDLCTYPLQAPGGPPDKTITRPLPTKQENVFMWLRKSVLLCPASKSAAVPIFCIDLIPRQLRVITKFFLLTFPIYPLTLSATK